MPRLTSLEKGGYYAFPDEHLPAVASLFTPAPDGGRLLDPCAGEGRALQHLANAWKLTPYANELDTDRAAVCQALFGPIQAVQGDLYTLRASLGSFPAIWLNPPYTWETGSGEDKRRELGMLKHSWKWLQAGGWMMWCVYAHHVTPDAASFLAKHCRSVEVWRLPGLHLGEYVHVVVVAQEGTPPQDPAFFAQHILQDAAHPHELSVQDSPLYAFPPPRTKQRFVFAPKVITPELALQAVQADGAQFGAGFQRLLQPPPPVENVRPVVRPRGGQLALVLAAGLFNGIVVQTETGRAAVRSTVEPVEQLVEGAEIDESDETTTEREVYRTRPQVTITLLDEQGRVTDMSGDAALVDFIGSHKTALLDYLDQHFKPLYDFRYDHLAPLLNRVRIKGNALYPTQRHVIAATYTALQHRKGVIVVGEPGVGKTALGATLAIALRPHMRPDQVVIVTSPPHLTGKWQREIEMVARSVGVQVHTAILKRVDDVRAFMDADLPQTLKVGIIPREMAKLGEGWEPAVQWRTVRTARWNSRETRPDNLTGDRIVSLKVPICPSCSATITRTKNGEAVIADESWLARAPQKCPSCGGALWQFTRTFSAPKAGEKFPKRNPRMPLADYIAAVFPKRVYLLLGDEVHESKSTTTDQGAALMTFAQIAQKVVGLTGTLYGGKASELYGLEFSFNERVRQQYPWGTKGQAAWVQAMGVLERIVEYRPEYDKGGHYTGKRRIEQKPKEAPGCSPLLVREIIDHTVFVGLQDIGRAMPEFEEIPVPIPMDPDMALHYHRAKDRLGAYLFQCRMEGDASFLGKYLQTLLSWPTAPFRAEKIIHKRRFDRESDVFLEIPMHDMLQNKTYTGHVCHSETLYNGTLGQGKKSSRHRKTWYEGKHQGFITDELFKVCQQVREGMVSHRMPTNRRRTYVLHHRVFCARCLVAMPRGLQDDNYGKMRPAWDRRRGTGYYRCLCKERGYEDCGQLSIREDDLNEQVVAVLSGLVIPEDFCERVENAVRSRVENEASLQRMAEIREIIERIDFRWDYGFIDWDEYFKKRVQLEREIESLRSIDYDELHEAADLIRNFRSYWEQCAETDEPDEARQQLLAKIVEQVIVYDNHVVAIALHGDFNVILDDEGSMPVEIADVLGEKITARHSEMTRGRCGSDGHRPLGGYVIFGRRTDYRRCVETIFSFKQAA